MTVVEDKTVRGTRINKKLGKLELKANKLKEMQRKIEEEMQQLRLKVRASKRKKMTRMNGIIGAMILRNVDRGLYPKDKLLAELDSHITTERDRKLLAELVKLLNEEDEDIKKEPAVKAAEAENLVP